MRHDLFDKEVNGTLCDRTVHIAKMETTHEIVRTSSYVLI